MSVQQIKAQFKEIYGAEWPLKALEQHRIKIKNVLSDTIPDHKRIEASKYANDFWAGLIPGVTPSIIKTNAGFANNWYEVGPKSIGGRILSLHTDINAGSNTLWAGSAGGGLWKAENAGCTTNNIDPVWQLAHRFSTNYAVSTIAQNPVNPQIMYYGTGEGWFGNDLLQGDGIYRSLDGGATWSKCSGTEIFPYIQKIVVNNVGHAFAATRNAGILRSTDNGATWTCIAGINTTTNPISAAVGGVNFSSVSDIEIASNTNTLVASFGYFGENVANTGNGYTVSGRMFRSTNGGTIWTQVFFPAIPVAAGPTFATRIEIATNNANNVVYAAVAATDHSLFRVFRTANINAAIVAWTMTSEFSDVQLSSLAPANPGGNQANYNLALVQHPTNSAIVFCGLVDLFRTTNSGTNWSQLNTWRSGLTCPPSMHGDIHGFSFMQHDQLLYIATDGGVYRSSNFNNTNTPVFTDPNPNNGVITDITWTCNNVPTFTATNDFLNVTQFYSVALGPINNRILGGTQDNGTRQITNFECSTGTMPQAGEGGFTHIDQNGPAATVSYVDLYNWKYNHTSSSTISIANLPIPLNHRGRFINPSDLDWNNNILYAAAFDNTNSVVSTRLLRWNNIVMTQSSTAASFALPGMENRMISAITVSPNTPSTIYLGTGPMAGLNDQQPMIVRVTNANTTAANGNLNITPISPALINGTIITAWESGLTISCINVLSGSVNANGLDMDIVVTFSNYDNTNRSIWRTTNAGVSWYNIDTENINNQFELPDIPVHWAVRNPNNFNSLIVATEAGIYMCKDMSSAATQWIPVAYPLSNIRVDMLKIRPTDNLLVAASHGRGVFYSDYFTDTRIAQISSSDYSVCPGQTMDYKVALSLSAGVNPPSSCSFDVNGDGIYDMTDTSIDPLDNSFSISGISNHRYNFVARLNYPTKSRGAAITGYLVKDNNCNPAWTPCNTYDAKNIPDDPFYTIEEIDVNIYPNPAANYLILEGLDRHSDIIIYDLQGKQMYNARITDDQERLDISKLNQGAYILYIPSKSYSSKFIKN